jgi:hypothetical protein
VVGSPAAIATSNTTFEVFTRSYEGNIHRTKYNGSWGDCLLVDGSGTAMAPPTVAHRFGLSASDLEVFWTNINGRTQNTFLADFGWSTNPVATGLTFGQISPVSRAPGRIDLWVTGTDANLYQSTSTQENAWTGWHAYILSNGIGVTGTPFAASATASSFNIFTRATNGNPRNYNLIDGQTATAPELTGGATVGGPVAVSWSPGRLDVFLRQTDTHLRHYWGDGTTWGVESFNDAFIK